MAKKNPRSIEQFLLVIDFTAIANRKLLAYSLPTESLVSINAYQLFLFRCHALNIRQIANSHNPFGDTFRTEETSRPQDTQTIESEMYSKDACRLCEIGGGSRIRTHGARKRPTVFKTAAFGRSAIPPIL